MDQKKKLDFLYHEICSCMQLTQYLEAIEQNRDSFRHCQHFFCDFIEVLSEALIVRLYALLEKKKDTLNVRNIYKTITKKQLTDIDHEIESIIKNARCNFVGHKNSDKNLNAEGPKAIKDALQQVPSLIKKLWLIYSEICAYLKPNAGDVYSDYLVSTAAINLIDNLAIGAGLLDNENKVFVSSCSSDIVRELRISSRRNKCLSDT